MKKYSLPKEFAEKWVEALISGEYKQGTGYLYSCGTYCCLGVACKVENYEDDRILSEGVIPHGLDGIPPLLIGNASKGNFIGKLTDRNDSGRWDFNRIADWIETNVNFI